MRLTKRFPHKHLSEYLAQCHTICNNIHPALQKARAGSKSLSPDLGLLLLLWGLARESHSFLSSLIEVCKCTSLLHIYSKHIPQALQQNPDLYNREDRMELLPCSLGKSVASRHISRHPEDCVPTQWVAPGRRIHTSQPQPKKHDTDKETEHCIRDELVSYRSYSFLSL